MNIDAIDEAAEKWVLTPHYDDNGHKGSFKAGALSDAAKQYWFEQFKAEQKQSAGVTEVVSFIRELQNEIDGHAILEKSDFNRGVYYSHFGDLNTAISLIEAYTKKPASTPQKQTIVTDLPAPPWDDSVTHNLELVSVEEAE